MASKPLTKEQLEKLRPALKENITKILNMPAEKAVSQLSKVFIECGITPPNVSVNRFTIKDGKITAQSLATAVYEYLSKAKKLVKENEKKEEEKEKKEEKESEQKYGISFNFGIPREKIKELAKNKDKTAVRAYLQEEFKSQAAAQGVPLEKLGELCKGINLKNANGTSTPHNVGDGKTLLDICCDLYMAMIYGMDKEQIFSESKDQTQRREQMESQAKERAHEISNEHPLETESMSSTQVVISEEGKDAFGPSRSVSKSETFSVEGKSDREIVDAIIDKILQEGEATEEQMLILRSKGIESLEEVIPPNMLPQEMKKNQ